MPPPMELPKNLSAETVAVFKHPLAVECLTEICRMFGGAEYLIYRDGEWVVIVKEVEP